MIREFIPDRAGDPRTQHLSFIRSDDKSRSLWQYLKRYENPTYNDKVLKIKFPGMAADLRKQKSQHVADAIRQAEAYYTTARTSELAIKPLILYYGALNLVKALLMFADNDITLDNTVQRSKGLNTHGLTNGASAASDVAIRNDNTKILEEYCLVTQPTKTLFSLLHNCWSNTPLVLNGRLELGDLASMHPSSWRSYSEYTSDPPKYFKLEGASFRTPARGEEHVVLFGGTFNILTYRATIPTGTENNFAFFENHFPRLGSLYERDEHLQNGFYSKSMPTSIDDYQPAYRETTGGQFLIEDASIGQPLHLIEVEFAMLFILGSLTRYVPQKWLQNVNYNGDGEMFVVEGFINSAASTFPKLILEELEGREYTFTGDVSYWG